MKISIQNQYPQSIRRFLRTNFPHLSQALIHKSIRNKDVLVNNEKVEIDQQLKVDDIVQVWSRLTEHDQYEVSQRHQYKFLETCLMDRTDYMWVLNKPAGLAVQSGTNVKTSLDYLLTGWMVEYNAKPHLVHRLDKKTSGVILVATSSIASYQLASLFANRKIHKTYLALCLNLSGKIFTLYQTGMLKERIDGREALTRYKVMGVIDNMLLMEFYPLTGRKHQIRIHCAMYSIPIVGDPLCDTEEYQLAMNNVVYSKKIIVGSMYLHAYKIKSETTTNLLRPFSYQAALPECFLRFRSFVEYDE